MGAVEIAVIVLVLGGRLFLPLLIPYVPVVGLLACLILDTVDQTIFQQFPAIELDGYQQYDKALDIYYLAIAYLSTMRNWTSQPAFRVSQFLFYYRLVGDLLFELTHARALLFIFPNTFEYFFLFVELTRLRWDQQRFSMKFAIVSAAVIWVCIKLPQEYWIHIAQMDVTEAIGANLWVLAPMAAIVIGILWLAWWIIFRKAPPADRRFRLMADPLPPELTGRELYQSARAHGRIFDLALAEKAVLVGLIAVIFAQFMTADPDPVETIVSVAVFVLVNAFLSQWLARRGRTWRSVAVEPVGMIAVNFAIITVLELVERLVGFRGESIPLVLLLFFLFLLSLLVVLFDRYHMVYAERRRRGREGRNAPALTADEAAAPS